jgi:GEVED domain/Secretion system C-terminal sorting domain
MKKLFTSILFAIVLIASAATAVKAQCTAAQLNWDNLDYLVTSGSYSAFVTNAQASSQNFTIGTNRVNIAASTTNFTLNGENTTHTGDLATYTGNDVEFFPIASGDSVVITFDQPVTNPNFTLYDIDKSAVYTITARDASNAPVVLTIGFQATTILTLGGTPTVRTITATNVDIPNNQNDGSATVSFPGLSVKTINITITARGTGGGSPSREFWLSDINACVTGSFPTSFRGISQPFTGMPAYVLTVRNNEFYLLDPATGKAKSYFTDPGWTNMNGMGYDPYKRILYYTYSLRASAPGGTAGTKTIYKYSVDNETISTFVADVTAAPLNIPTYDPGVTSGSASFYNGSLYFGVESSDGSLTTGRENTVWKIDFAADSITPLRASQVYASRVDSNISGTDRLIHDWSDIGVTKGILYDFDGSRGDSMFYHFNLMTGQRTEFLPSGAGNIGPKQTAIDWQENVYNMGGLPTDATSALNIGGYIVPYNYNGTVNNAQSFLVSTNPGPAYPTGSWGDCSEAFRPTCDFGDAPASYDPVALSPAVNEKDTAIRIGATWDREWLKTSSALANGDGSDEDGLAFVPIFSRTAGTYLAQVSVYNNTGGNATLIAWLDFNANGVFDAGEACQAPPVVTSMASMQNRYLYWPSAPTTIPNGSYTYLRIRLVRGSSGMTNSNPTGYYDNGETEDYRVLVDNYLLKADLLSFNAKIITNNTVELKWNSSGEENFNGYEIQRSADNINWSKLDFVNAKGNGLASENAYSYNDLRPLTGNSFYRLKLVSGDGKFKNSDIRTVAFNKGIQQITLSPNPAGADNVILSITTSFDASAAITLTDITGQIVHRQINAVKKGINSIDLSVTKRLPGGMYYVQVAINNDRITKKLVIKSN